MTYRREQKIYAIRLADKFFVKGAGWAPDIERAFIAPERTARGTVRMNIGMPCDLVEVYPQIAANADIIPVE